MGWARGRVIVYRHFNIIVYSATSLNEGRKPDHFLRSDRLHRRPLVSVWTP